MLRRTLSGFAKAAAAAAVVAAAAAMVATATPASAAPGDGLIRDAGTAEVVANSYIVVLRGGGEVAGSARNLTGRYGGAVTHTYTTALRGFAVRSDEAGAKRLAADPAVEYVQRNGVLRLAGTQQNPPSWGLDRIDQRDRPLNNSYVHPDATTPVTVYVIDTGVRITHTTFGGRARYGRDTVDGDDDAGDCNGHGTQAAGTVGGSTFGVAKTVNLVAVRALNCNGDGTTASVVAAVDWVTANHVRPAVANMSLSGGVDPAVDSAVANSIAAGVSYAVAAGNGDDVGNPVNACGVSPARVPAAITVAATQTNDARAAFSNFGPCLDIFAPGVNITSASSSGDAGAVTSSGTSTSAPHVAGAAALLLAARPTLTPQQVRDELISRATTGKVPNPGAGSPNLLLFVTATGTEPPPPLCTVTNGTDIVIPDDNTVVSSAVTIVGCDRPATGTSTAEVHIRHTWRGDLVIDLVAPDGTAYRLKNSTIFDSGEDVNVTYTVNVSSETANGTWQLRVRDAFGGDTGFIDSWTLTV